MDKKEVNQKNKGVCEAKTATFSGYCKKCRKSSKKKKKKIAVAYETLPTRCFKWNNVISLNGMAPSKKWGMKVFAQNL